MPFFKGIGTDLGRQSDVTEAAQEGVVVAPTGKELAERYPGLHRAISVMSTEADLNVREGGVIDPYTIMNNILDADVNTDDVDALFGLQTIGSTASKDFLDTPFYLTGDAIMWMKTTIADAPFPFYAMMTVRTVEGDEEVTLNGGGSTFCAMLFKLRDSGYFDKPEFKEKGAPLVLKGKGTLSGNTVVLIQPWGTRKPAKRANGGARN
jgi:hypothetical protein